MRIPKLFRKPKINPSNTRLFFEFDSGTMVNSNTISTEIKTKKKYYHEVFCKDLVHGSNTPDGVMNIGNIAMYIGVSYKGTKMESLKDTIKNKQGDLRYPLFFFDEEHFAVYLEDLRKYIKSIHMETGFRNNKVTTKYIFHYVDGDQNTDIYLVVWNDETLRRGICNYLMMPIWCRY